MMKDKISVFSCSEMSEADEAKVQLLAASAALHQKAAECLAEGMFCEAQSSRLETLVLGCADEELVRVRDLLVAEGLLEVEGDALEVTAPGGEA